MASSWLCWGNSIPLSLLFKFHKWMIWRRCVIVGIWMNWMIHRLIRRWILRLTSLVVLIIGRKTNVWMLSIVVNSVNNQLGLSFCLCISSWTIFSNIFPIINPLLGLFRVFPIKLQTYFSTIPGNYSVKEPSPLFQMDLAHFKAPKWTEFTHFYGIQINLEQALISNYFRLILSPFAQSSPL